MYIFMLNLNWKWNPVSLFSGNSGKKGMGSKKKAKFVVGLALAVSCAIMPNMDGFASSASLGTIDGLTKDYQASQSLKMSDYGAHEKSLDTINNTHVKKEPMVSDAEVKVEEKASYLPFNNMDIQEPVQIPVKEITGTDKTKELSYGNALSMEATGYSRFDPGCGNYTATGEYLRYGIAAVDPDVIPLGTDLYIEGYGHAVALDTGGAIVGHRIDLAFDSHQEALNWGRRNVTVYIQ